MHHHVHSEVKAFVYRLYLNVYENDTLKRNPINN